MLNYLSTLKLDRRAQHGKKRYDAHKHSIDTLLKLSDSPSSSTFTFSVDVMRGGPGTETSQT